MVAPTLFAVALLLASPGLGAEGASRPRAEAPPVTVFFQFESPANARTVQFMRTEIDRLFAPVPTMYNCIGVLRLARPPARACSVSVSLFGAMPKPPMTARKRPDVPASAPKLMVIVPSGVSPALAFNCEAVSN